MNEFCIINLKHLNIKSSVGLRQFLMSFYFEIQENNMFVWYNLKPNNIKDK